MSCATQVGGGAFVVDVVEVVDDVVVDGVVVDGTVVVGASVEVGSSVVSATVLVTGCSVEET